MKTLFKINSVNLALDNRRVTEFTLHLFYFFLLVISLVQYLERTLPFDGAFYCFKIIHNNWFNIEHGRWGAFYNQLLPLIGLKTGCSLVTFLKLYSFSFIFCNYLFFLIIYYRLKQFYTALAFSFLQVVFFRYNFYYQVSEAHAIMGPAFLLLAGLCSENFIKQNKYSAILFVVCIFIWLINTHLLSFIVILFIFSYALIYNKDFFKNKKLWIAIALCFIYFVYFYLNIPKNSYQSEKLITLDGIRFVFTNLSESAGFIHFKEQFFKNYLLAGILLLITVLFYLLKKQFLKLMILIFSVIGFWIIYMAYTIKHEAPINLENFYPVFGYFILIPFCLDVLKNLKSIILFSITLLLISTSLFKILKCGTMLTEQVDYYKRVTNNARFYKERKFMIPESHIDWDKIWMDWDISFQSLLVSSLSHPDSSITFYTPLDINEHKEIICCDSNAFIGVDFAPFQFKTDDFPKTYFNLKKGLYKLLTTPQDSLFNISVFNKSNLTLEFHQPKLRLLRASYRTIPVTINNLSENTFNSLLTNQSQLYIGYRILEKKTGKVIHENRSVVETDILPGTKTESGIKINVSMLERGSYYITADFVLENRYWFNNEKKIEFSVF